MIKFISMFLIHLVVISCGKYMPNEIQKPKNLAFNSAGSANVKIESNFINSSQKTLVAQSFNSSEKRILILFSSQRCSACLEEHAEFKKLLDQNFFHRSKFEIISLMIATEFSDSYDFESVNELMVKSGMDWPIGEDIDLKYFNMFCEGKTTPCSVVVEPSIGIVFTHNGIPDFNELKSILNK